MPLPRAIELKRKRSREHLRRLSIEVRRRVADLNREGVIRQIDQQTGDHTWVVNAPDTTTDRTAVLAGDFVHNLRSLLDHIVYALATEPDKRPLPEWPIYEKEGPGSDAFHPTGMKKIRSLPPEARAIIEGFQPYKDGNDPLLRLQRLDNIDKHRRLIATPYGVRSNSITGPSFRLSDIQANLAAGKPTVLFSATNLSMRTGRFRHGDVVARAGFENTMEALEQVKVNPRFQVALEEDGISREIITEFTKMYEFVDQVVLPKFGHLF